MKKQLTEMDSFSSKLWYNKRSILKNGNVSLYLQVVINGKHKEFPLKLQWPADRINLVQGVLLSRTTKDSDVSDYNLMIMIEQGKHTEIFKDYRIRKIPLEISLFTNVLEVFDQKESFVGYMKRTILMRYNSKDITWRTYANHNSVLASMIKFNGAWRFENVNVAWMKKFKTHFSNSLIKKKGAIYGKPEPGNVWTTIKTIKAYLQIAMLDPIINVNSAAADFPNPQPSWKTTYLNNAELKRLMSLLNNGLTDNQRKILQAFLFQCFTSLRISDIYRANAKWRVSEDFLDFIPKKNMSKGRWIHVPIMPLANTFIKDSLGQYFQLPNEGEYNEVLKDLAGFAGINKVLTSHVGRHTFGYLYMTTVGNLVGLKEVMGHSDIKTTMRYAHLDDDYKTDSVMQIQNKISGSLLSVVG